MTRIQLATGFIDLPKDTDFPIDLSFAEITKLGKRSGGASRSLDIDGTDNNLEQLGLYFDIDLSNDTFDRNKKTTCSIIENGVETFEGYIQLLEIVRVNKSRGTNRKHVKLKISVFDEVSNFFNQMGDKELTELSFPEFSHVFNRANIITSWSNTAGYTYPQYAKNDNIYTLRDFKPAIYEYEYWKKIFASNGYTFTFDQYTDDDIRLNQRIIPYNGKQGDDTVGAFLKQSYTVRGEMATDSYLIDSTNVPTYPVGWLPIIDYLSGNGANTYATNAGSKIVLSSIFEDAQAQWSLANGNLENKAGQGRIFQLNTSYDYAIQVRSSTAATWQANVGVGATRCEIKLTLVAQSTTNNQKIAYIDAGQTVIAFNSGTHTYGAGWQSLGSGTNASFADLGVFDANEKFDVHVLVMARYFNSSGVLVPNNPNFQTLNSLAVDSPFVSLPVEFVDTASGNPIRLEFDIDITNLQFKAVPDITELAKGSNVDVSQFIPKKIKQRDLISAIKSTYNLVFLPDPLNDRNIIVKTRDQYYEDGDEWIWTDKFQEAEPNSITFLSNEVKNKQVYKYSEDKDELNTAYQTEFGETYGQTTIQLDNEYTVGTDERTIIYSATPSVGSAIGVPLPSINGVNPDCNIRVLLHNGLGSVTAYPFYDDLLPNTAELAYVDDYCKTSMFDDDISPNFAILYDSPKILFHNFQQGQTTNYLYNMHHQQELTTINEGERLTGYFNITPGDFQKLAKQLDWKIFIKDNGWFFISKVNGYNSGKTTLTKVDLITADEKTRLKYRKPIKPVNPTTVSVAGTITKHFKKVAQDTNIVIGGGYVSIDGKYNYVASDKVYITGDQNKVLSSDVIVMGNYNVVDTGLNGVKILGDSKTPTSPTEFTGGNFANDDLVFDAVHTHDLNGFGVVIQNGGFLVDGNSILQNTLSTGTPTLSITDSSAGDSALFIDTNNGGLAIDIDGGGIKLDATGGNSNVSLGIDQCVYFANCPIGGMTITLPTITHVGFIYIIKHTTTVGTVTIDTAGTELIDGAASINLTTYQSAKLVFNGTDWFIV